ncbi:hypothetical protein [Paraurantiacibacter namhicola]|uniref:Uncharacterized protein n=1 Tax=Paraurantiacibacter namhicola TaxID=645517 RepID=A0A1C7D9I0_9SPHN|nr:hypothetical protein [Paraurantiacibacter namhicola]ANU07963.1 hypothetical protein A6F65_01665 [Paraurantiacibacter namhicola]
MNEGGWVSIIALLGWLFLAVGAWRSYQVSGKRAVTYILIWGCLFLTVALGFMLIGK